MKSLFCVAFLSTTAFAARPSARVVKEARQHVITPALAVLAKKQYIGRFKKDYTALRRRSASLGLRAQNPFIGKATRLRLTTKQAELERRMRLRYFNYLVESTGNNLQIDFAYAIDIEYLANVGLILKTRVDGADLTRNWAISDMIIGEVDGIPLKISDEDPLFFDPTSKNKANGPLIL